MTTIYLDEIVDYQYAMAAWRTQLRVRQNGTDVHLRRSQAYRMFLRRGPPALRRIKKAYDYNPGILRSYEFDFLCDMLETDFKMGYWAEEERCG